MSSDPAYFVHSQSKCTSSRSVDARAYEAGALADEAIAVPQVVAQEAAAALTAFEAGGSAEDAPAMTPGAATPAAYGAEHMQSPIAGLLANRRTPTPPLTDDTMTGVRTISLRLSDILTVEWSSLEPMGACRDLQRLPAEPATRRRPESLVEP